MGEGGGMRGRWGRVGLNFFAHENSCSSEVNIFLPQ